MWLFGWGLCFVFCVVLVGVLAERFLALKEKRGIVNNTELVRLLLTDALNKEEPQPHGDVHP